MPRVSIKNQVEDGMQIPIGRSREMQVLQDCLAADSSPVVHLHGIAGIGKTHLQEALVSWARDDGAAVYCIDCRSTEPTSRGFLGELRSLLGTRARSVSRLAQELGQAADRTLLVLDSYEHFRLLDAWLRHEFVSFLPDNVCMVMAGRPKPGTGWRTQAGVKRRTVNIPLEPLDEGSSLRLLKKAGVKSEAAKRVILFTHGHPLALKLTIAALNERPGLRFEGLAIQGVLEELTRMFLADVNDPVARQLLIGVSVLRRITIPLLEALFPSLPAQDSYEILASLPFIEATRHGLMLHDAVRSAMARSLRARDPSACTEYRRAAWTRLSRDLSHAADPELWRYTADLLYILDNPIVREAFFPSGESWLEVEAAQARDDEGIRDIISRHHGPEGAAVLNLLQDSLPDTLSVVRGEDQDCQGFYMAFDPAKVEVGLLESDPVSTSWLEHLRRNPLPEGQRALFIRRWLSVEEGEAPSESQAACWLDIKRSYIEMRPQLQRVYLTMENPAPFAAVAGELGFTLPLEMRVELDGQIHHGAVLDFGPGSVDAWLAGLLASEIGVKLALPELDVKSQELLIEGRRVRLTRLEFKVYRYLVERPGDAVSRTSLLNDVWGLDYEGGSNVVDTVMASLRKKLAGWSKLIKTISGTGYSYRPSV
jgi:hypothetical protein